MDKFVASVVVFVVVWALAFVLAVPGAFLLMLFLGNVGVNVSFWGAFPGAFLLAIIRSQVNNK